MKPFKDYDKTKAYGDVMVLPKGGYICKIMGVETCRNSNGEYLKIGVDIAEGEYINFYANDYIAQQGDDKKWHCNYLLNIPKDDGTEQDGWTKRKFKTWTTALEESNTGYHWDWDETKWKGKLFGGLFNIREYEKSNGDIGSATNLAQVTTVEKIKAGTFKLPDDKLLERRPSAPASSDPMDFVQVPDSELDELPFN